MVDGKKPSYGPIYIIELVKLEIKKIYIKTNIANSFIPPLKFLIDAFIFFICKFNSSFCLCVNYLGLNNLIIKNQYLLLLISKFLNWLK